MEEIPLRIGVWFNILHVAYGGPSMVLIGTILGFMKQKKPILILLNEVGDVNWFLDSTHDFVTAISQAPNAYVGPMGFSNEDAELKDCTEHELWKYGKHFLLPSDWYRWWIQQGLPFDKPEKALGRTCDIWGAGVDIDFFKPDTNPTPMQDFFIYFKSQNYKDLQNVHQIMFDNYFHFRGSTVSYYHYDKYILKHHATQSRFCIMLDLTETQGLASLEIMACNCPVFVIDCTTHKGKRLAMGGATSVPCMDDRCGMKSSLLTMVADLKVFLSKLSSYKPREYVCESYSYEAAAHNLLTLISRKHH